MHARRESGLQTPSRRVEKRQTSSITGAALYWVTGLPGAGKTTLARELEQRLRQLGESVVLLDGDALRAVLGGKHGYDYAARFELAMTYVRLSRLLCEQGHTVVCATVSMFEEVRQWARSNIAGYREIFVRAPDAVLHERRALYRSSISPELMVGSNPRYELPVAPHALLDNDGSRTPADLVDELLSMMQRPA
jgi:cytidine diphosphoramidate kinase